MKIPAANTPERKVFDNTVVGRLYHGHFYCTECSLAHIASVDVYGVNIAPYSAVCCQCGQLVIDGVKKANGSGPLTIFD